MCMYIQYIMIDSQDLRNSLSIYSCLIHMTIEYHVFFISYTVQTSWLEHMGIYLYIEITNIGESEVLWKPWWFCMTRSIIATKNGSWSKGFLELHVLSSVLLISHVDFYPHWTYIQYTSTFLVKRQCSRSNTCCLREFKYIVLLGRGATVLVCLADHPWPQAKKTNIPYTWKINMEHNHGGLVQIIFLSKWVMAVGSSR